jgi:hypothetical protein
VQTYPDLDAMLADAGSDAPTPGPLKGKPALRAKLRNAADYLDAMRRLVPIRLDAALDVWAGDRWDEALIGLAEEQGLKGPVQRLLAVLDSYP